MENLLPQSHHYIHFLKLWTVLQDWWVCYKFPFGPQCSLPALVVPHPEHILTAFPPSVPRVCGLRGTEVLLQTGMSRDL